jgi:hypothetical protein
VVVNQGNLFWRSHDLKVPEAELLMVAMPPPFITPEGQQ